jgi:Uncharacterized conserved protein
MTAYCDNRVLVKVKPVKQLIPHLNAFYRNSELEEEEGVLIMNCSFIHSFFMKRPIDAVYLSEDLTVLGVETLKPWRIGTHIRKTAHILGMKEGTAWVGMGDMLDIQ